MAHRVETNSPPVVVQRLTRAATINMHSGVCDVELPSRSVPTIPAARRKLHVKNGMMKQGTADALHRERNKGGMNPEPMEEVTGSCLSHVGNNFLNPGYDGAGEYVCAKSVLYIRYCNRQVFRLGPK